MRAGTGLPTIRLLSQRYAAKHGALIRINLREPEIHSPDLELGIAGGALEVLDALVRG